MNGRKWSPVVRAGGTGPWGWISALLIIVISGRWAPFPLLENEVWNPQSDSWYLTQNEWLTDCPRDYEDECSGGLPWISHRKLPYLRWWVTFPPCYKLRQGGISQEVSCALGMPLIFGGSQVPWHVTSQSEWSNGTQMLGWEEMVLCLPLPHNLQCLDPAFSWVSYEAVGPCCVTSGRWYGSQD